MNNQLIVDAPQKWCKQEGVIYTSVTEEGGVIIPVAILPGLLFQNSSRTTGIIRTMAEKNHFRKPDMKIGNLICRQITRNEIASMNLVRIVIMGDAVKQVGGASPRLLSVGTTGRDWVDTKPTPPAVGWRHDFGFAFLSDSKT